MAWALALLVPAGVALAVGWRATTGTRDRLAAAPVAIGVALGLASVVWSALFFGGIHSRGLLLALDILAWILVLIAGVTLTRARRDPIEAPAVAEASRLTTAAAVTLVIVTAAAAVLSFMSASAVFPHGEWDAWAQWNRRARFFFRGLVDGSWHQAFAPVLAWSHADYPPLVPASVARLWTYAGRETLLAPIAFAGIIAACTVLAAGHVDRSQPRGGTGMPRCRGDPGVSVVRAIRRVAVRRHRARVFHAGGLRRVVLCGPAASLACACRTVRRPGGVDQE